MNSLGLSLVWVGLQVSIFCVAGSALYLVARRRSPATGAWAAGAALIMAVGITAIALAPWPRWWSLELEADTSEIAADDGSSQIHETPSKSKPSERLAPGLMSPPIGPRDTVKKVAAPAMLPVQQNGWRAMLARVQLVSRQASNSAWGWPAWIATVLAGGCGLALARLIAAVAFARGYSATARPLADGSLAEMMEQVRAQIGCTRSIEVREIAGLGSPATMGWLRPTILLPADWRLWSAEQLRAVLAHEVAHVARGDFATSLIAQFGVALHFYNPLVHWLARRLRLEQEMAADVWGAAVLGNRQRYLTTLAEMAIARSDPPAAWAMRPFLPTRGTLMRRVEMLHSQKILPKVSLSNGLRTALAIVLLVAASLVAGLRGPAIRQVVAAPPELAQATEGKAEAKGSAISLDFVPNDAQLVLAARPAELVATKSLAPLAAALAEVGLFEQVGLPLAEIEEFKFVGAGDFNFQAGKQPWTLLVLRAKKPFDWSKLANYFVGEAKEAIAEGQSYFEKVEKQDQGGVSRPGSMSAYWLPDDRTIVIGPKEHIAETFSLRGSLNGPAWADKWNAKATGPAGLVIGTKFLSFMLNSSERDNGPGPDLSVDADVLLFTGAESGGAFRVAGLLECKSPEVAATTKGRLTTALGKIKQEMTAATGPGDPAGALMVRIFSQLIAQTKIEQQGASLTSETLLTQNVGQELKAAVGPARAAAFRARSVNNMKQIAIALHNYHDVNKHFPAAVVMGPDGKTPHSWRVEILPYLEVGGQNVYKQYRMNEPWDSEHNKKLIDAISIFNVPGEKPGKDCGYFFATGAGTAFDPVDKPSKIREITDGTSRTIAIVEAKRSIPWTKPEDIEFDPDKPLPKLGGYFEGGFNAGLFDGSVHFLADDLDEKTLRAMVSSRGREIITNDPATGAPKVQEVEN